MNHAFVVLALVFSMNSLTFAQTKADEKAARQLPQAFCDAWAKHDGHQLAGIMAEDVDFVTVGADWFHGRADFERYHVRLLSGRFKEASNTPLQIEVRFLDAHVAVVHWTWRIAGDKNFDGTPRQPRYGIMTMVAEKRKGGWLVVAAQNTNFNPDLPPELQGISLHAAFPQPDKAPR